ncbi:uncharacterized protein LOC124154265 [Ischnura elegans]|uniref:uncharacterized protein LOC124154265 n=1 Tax=Ischnura elegans TaxID=197161 RepID=UPI001ED87E7F|nr:uncharacterized protein LOC124154265 [Ischnura elegans]
MTPGWRRWTAILTTYTCLLFGGAIAYRIRVPPPGQLVALSGDDLRVELDLPPPGRGGAGGGPSEAATRSRGQRDGGGGEEDGPQAMARRDGELWIELVDMEMGKETAARRRRRMEGGGRWRREEGGGGSGETMGRREIGGGEKKKRRKEEGEEDKRSGRVRPKGEKEENALRPTAKEEDAMIGGGKWVGGKVRWSSWGGRGGNAVKMTEGGGGGRQEEEGELGGRAGEGESGEQEEQVADHGLILETALVSKGWRLPLDTTPSSPHSTLALTFPASHFTHGGLYVVRLVGTGRVVSNPGTQRPQRDAVTTEGSVEESGGVGADERSESRAANARGGVGREQRGRNESLEGGRGMMKVAEDGGRGKASHGGRVRTADEEEESMRRMYGRILEALENRERWEEYDRSAVPKGRRKRDSRQKTADERRRGRGEERQGVKRVSDYDAGQWEGMGGSESDRGAEGGVSRSEEEVASASSLLRAYLEDRGGEGERSEGRWVGEKRRRRNEEGNLAEEPVIERLGSSPGTENYDSISLQSDFSSRLRKRDLSESKVEESTLGSTETSSSQKTWTTEAIPKSTTTDGRVSREASKGCKDNCESTTSRQILAEENVLVSWPAARFTLNILSSSFSSAAAKPKPEKSAKNLTFETFEAPVRVLLEIPCGIDGVGSRSRREVSIEGLRSTIYARESEDSGRMSVRVPKEESAGRLRVMSSAKQENQKEESEENTGAREKRKRKGARGEMERLREGGRARRDLKGEQNHGEPWAMRTAGDAPPAEETSAVREIVMRIRKERVTKYDINDDALESLEEKAGRLGTSAYAMKREARVETRGGDLNGRGEGRTAAAGGRAKRAPTTTGSTRNPKTGLSPGPPKLPFRVFLVLRYCGVDSTECDEEEDAGKDSAEIWRRPQTVYTKELVDFPACPKYQHQVILPCEAFGQAGVYVVQVRSNYTLDAAEDGGAGKAEARRRRNIAAEQPPVTPTRPASNGEREPSRVWTESTTDGINGRRDSVDAFAAESTSRAYGDVSDGKISRNTQVIASESVEKKSEGSAGEIQDAGGNREGDELEDTGRTLGGGTGVFDAVTEGPALSRGVRGSSWQMGGSSWWESGSGDGEEEGSGGWGAGSGDAEYGDDPGEAAAASGRRVQLPDPPPGSLWSSSQPMTARLSAGYVFTVHARSVFPCSEAHVRPGTLEPAPSGVPVLFEYPECILEASDRIRVFGRARPDVAAILPPFWMGTDASTDAAVTLSHPSLRYVAEKKIYKGKHNAWFDCSLFTERYSEYCFAYASQAMTGAVTHVRAQCIPTLPTSDKDRGGWGSWSAWSQCSTTCGSGSRNRYRTCDNPPPRYGAPFCEGPALETEICPPPAGVTYEELQEMCPLGLALSATDDANRKGSEPNCRCGGCVVHLQGVAGSWSSRNAGPIKPRARLIASSSQACPGRSFWLLQAEPGHVVGLTVSSLLLPCPRRQWLKARDGDSLSSRLVLHLPSSSSAASGAPAYSTQALCFSSGPHLLLEFYSFERLEASCNGGFLAHAHQVLANSSASAIGRDILLTPTTRAMPRSSLSVHAVALAFILALLALSGGLALNYILRRRRFNEELKKREKEEEEMSDSDSDTKCFIGRNREGGSATSVTSVSDVISLRKLSVSKERRERREVHMRLTEESDEDEDEEEGARAILPRVEVLRPTAGTKGRRARVETADRGGVRGVVVQEEEEAQQEVTRRRRRQAGPGRREWRESACPLLEPEASAVAQSSISLPSSPTEAAAAAAAEGEAPGLSASAPLLLRRSLSFFAATASASTAGAAGDSPPEATGGVALSISAAGKQWWRRKMQRFQNGSVSPVREELEETWRLADSSGKKQEARQGGAEQGAVPPAKECKEKQNRERLLRRSGASPCASDSTATSPDMSRPGSNGGRLRGRLLRAARAADGKCTSEASLAGGASELDLEFDYYDYNVQNAGAAPGSYLGMDPAFLVYIPPFEGSSSSNASSASTLQAPPSEGTDALLSAPGSPQPPGGAAGRRGDYYCINASYARANFQEAGGGRRGEAGSEGETLTMSELRRSSEEEEEEGRGSEKETRVEKSPVEELEEDEEEIRFADEDDEEEDSERAKITEYGVITADSVGLKKPV